MWYRMTFYPKIQMNLKTLELSSAILKGEK